MDVARQTGLDAKTVRNIADDYYEVLQSTHLPVTPMALGIDEAKIGGVYLGVITNVEKNTFVEVLRGRTRKHLEAYFGSLPNKENVKVVVTDLYNAYRIIATEQFPKAELVAHKFHVMRMANVAVENVRKHVRLGVTASRCYVLGCSTIISPRLLSAS